VTDAVNLSLKILESVRTIFLSIRRKLGLIRLVPFDTSTEEGRSNERHRRIALTAITSAAAKVITIATSFITVPLTLNYLGAERYGLWMTISSVIAMMVFADFGIGNGLLNAVSEAYGKDDKNAIRVHVANAAVILSGIALFILVSFFLIFPFISWGSFFNVKTQLATDEAGPALAAFMICFALGVPATIVQRVQMGLQRGFTSSLWQAGGSVLGLLLSLLVISFKGGLPWLISALAGAPVIMLLINGTIFFFIQCRELIPDMRQVSQSGMRQILHGGLLFFVLQLAGSLAFASDNVIIAQILGADAVAQYSVVAKLFEGVLIIISLAFSPLWPAYGEAKARGDKTWIKETLKRSMLTTLLLVISAAILLTFFYKPLLAIWVGKNHLFPFELVVLYAVWMIFKGMGGTYSMFLNGIHVLRLQLIIASMFTFVSIVLKIWFAYTFGLNGLLIALILSYVVTTVFPYALLTKKLIINT
jgi:O-antigen/teichoic acid export membrane protein